MKKILLSLLVVGSMVTASKAQTNPTSDEEKNMKSLAAAADAGWSRKGSVNAGATLNVFNQWAAGGINSLGLNGLGNYQANYRKGKHAWDNTFLLGYGLLNQGLQPENWIKTDDRLDITSKYGRPINEKLFYAALGNFQTQFSPGFAPGSNNLPDRTKKISDFLAPARLLLALGIDYKPSADLSIFFSPITYRGIYVFNQTLADAGAFGVEKAVYDVNDPTKIVTAGANVRTEIGAYLRVNYSKKLNENVNFTSKLELFSNYLDSPQNIDLNWENILACKLSKYFNLTLGAQFIYDDNTIINKPWNNSETQTYAGKGLQFRGLTSLGFAYNF
jgi:hypothetical protein